MNRSILLLTALLLLPSLALAQAPDADGDGVPDATDLCPAEDASLFDGDGDGCIDPFAHARHIEFWAPEDLPFQYVVHEGGAPLIDVQEVAYTPGDEIDELVAGIELWETIGEAAMASEFVGTTPDSTADGTDGINQITFRDPDFLALFGNSVLAVGLTTSFTEPSTFQGQPVRPGQIVDADMLFNPARTFSADTSESAVEIQAVAVHEAGHLFGLNHSAIPEATMFPALPAGFSATTFEIDDVMLAVTSYPAPAALPTLTSMAGSVVDGATGLPIPGAGVFALIAGTDQKVASQYTLPDGSWQMAGLPAGSYDIFVAPLDGGAAVNGIVPGFINELVDATAQTLFVPDYYDANESANEDPDARESVALAPGAPVTGLQIITNADTDAPMVQSTTPSDGQGDAEAEGVVLVRFTEPVVFSTVSQSGGPQRFRLERLDTGGPVGVGGQLVAIGSRDVLVFTPSEALTFDAEYLLTLEAGIEDPFGNAMSAPFEATFTVESRPPLDVTAVTPTVAVPGATVVVSGQGFDTADPGNNTVTLGGTPLTVQQVTNTSIVARIPNGVGPGVQTVDVSTSTESALGVATIEVVNVIDTARATPVASVPLAGRPHDVIALPDGDWTLAATDAGLEAVVTEGSSPAFGASRTQALPQGLDGIAFLAGGLRAVGVSSDARTLYLIDTDDGGDAASPLASFLSVLFEVPTGLTPLGVAIAPTRDEAFVTTAQGVIQVWDLRPGGDTQFEQIGEIGLDEDELPFSNLAGTLAFSIDGNRAYALTNRELQVIDVISRTVITTVPLGAEPAGVVESPGGDAIYVTDVDGNVSAIPVTASSPSQVIDTDASLRGIAIGPTGALAYATDRRDEEVTIVDLRASEASFRTVLADFTTGEDPIDVCVLPDGTGVITVSEGSQTLDVFGIGFGPVIESTYPAFVSPGDILAIGGSEFALSDSSTVSADTDVDFDGTLVGPSGTRPGDVSFWLDRGWARVPADYDGGPIRVESNKIEIGRRAVPEPGRLVSNPGFATVFTQEEIDRTRSGLPTQSFLNTTDPLGGAMSLNVAVHPKNAYALVDDGEFLSVIDLREESPTFLQVSHRFPLNGTSAVDDDFFSDRAFTPDGKLLYTSGSQYLNYFDADPDSPAFGQYLGTVDFSLVDPNGAYVEFNSLLNMEIVPDGSGLLIGVNLEEGLAYVPLRGAQANRATNAFSTSSGSANVEIDFHPNGRWAFLSDGSSLEILDLDPFSSGFLQTATTLPSIAGEAIEDVVVDLQGRGFWALTRFGGAGGQWKLWAVDFVDSPDDLLITVGQTVEVGAPEGRALLDLHPNGRRMAVNIPGRRVAYLDVEPTFTTFGNDRFVFTSGFDITSLGLFAWEGKFTPDGKRYVGIEQTDTDVRIFDYSFGGIGFDVVSGGSQVGAVSQTLPAPVRIRVVNEGGRGEVDVALRVTIQAGGGTIEDGLTERVFVSDANGEIAFRWTLGATPGENRVQIQSPYSGFTLPATAVVDPSTIPLSLVQILPATGATDVGVTTAVQVQFSRPVDRASVPTGTIVLRDQTSGAIVPAFQGFADSDRRVSLIPNAPLAYESTFVLEVPPTVADLDGNVLGGVATTSSFTTQAAPAPLLGSVSPPAGTVGVPFVIAGVGFDPTPGATTVTLNGTAVTTTAVSVNSIQAVVPNGAATGPLEVAVNGTPAGALTFTVLTPTSIPVDEVDDSIDLGSATQALAVLPNGLKGYAVSTATNQVIPVDLIALTNGTAIAVGDEPIGAVSDVAGTFVYVANRASNSVSVIDTATDAVVETILLQSSPEQILVSPNGDYVYVLTPTGEAVEVIDVDATSAAYNTVTARFTTGTGNTGGTVSPDGSVLYIATNDGFLTVDLGPTNFGVTARFTTGTGNTGGTVSPDGSILILFTNTDEILVIDVSGPGFGTVTARFTTGTGNTGGTVSPDGSILYVISAETDEIFAFSITVSGQVSTIEGLYQVDVQLVATIDGGDDPRWIAFDPRDPTVAFVGATGDQRINVFGRMADVDPPTCEAFDVVFGTSWDPEPSLQEILDASYGAGAIDAATDYEGYACDDAAVPYWLDEAVDGWIIREIGDYRGANVLGWYAENFTMPTIDGVDDGVIFDGGDPEGAVGFVGLNGPTRFGLYLNPNGAEDAINAPEPELFFTNRGYNDVGPDGSGTIHAPEGGDPQALIYDVTALRGGVPTYVIAWEDVDSGAEITTDYSPTGTDNDFNDLVIEIRASSPVRAVVSSLVAVPQADGVRVAWNVTGGVEVDTAVVERRRGDGAFEVVGQVDDADEYVDASLRDAGDYVYRVAVFVDGGRILSNEVEVSFAPQVVRTGLTKAYPNPFNPRTNIEFAIARPGDVKIKIYDVAGRLVKSFELGEQPVGTATVQWTGLDDKGRSVSSGVYLVKLVTPEKTDALRVVLLK